MPLPFNNYAVTRTVTEDLNSFDIRLDHQFSGSNTAFARYSFQNTDAFTPSLFGPPLGGTLEGAGPTFARNQNAAVGDVHQFGPSLLNEIRIGMNRQNLSLNQQDAGQNLSAQFGIPGVNTSPQTSGLSTLYVAGLFTVGDGLLTPLQLATTDGSLSEKLTWVHGRQVVRVGFDYQYGMGSTGYLVYGRGFYTFLNLTTSTLVGTAGGNAFASFLTGAPYQVLRDEFPPGMVGLISHRTWFLRRRTISKLHAPKLTVNIGLRATTSCRTRTEMHNPDFELRSGDGNDADRQRQNTTAQNLVNTDYRDNSAAAPDWRGRPTAKPCFARVTGSALWTRMAEREFSTAISSIPLFTTSNNIIAVSVPSAPIR